MGAKLFHTLVRHSLTGGGEGVMSAFIASKL